MHDFYGYDFGEEQGAVLPALNDPVMQWFHHRDAINEQGEDVMTRGWHIEAGQWPVIDYVCGLAQYPLLTINHPTSGVDAQHWQITRANFFILSDGVLGVSEMYDPQNRVGIAYGWQTSEDQKTGELRWSKKCHFRAFVEEFLPYFDEEHPLVPVTCVVTGTIVGDYLLPALESQARVIEANNKLIEQQHRRRIADGSVPASRPCPRTPYWGFSLPLGPGAKVTARPKNGGSQQGAIVNPILSGVPASFDPERDREAVQQYLKAHHCGELYQAIKELLPATKQWSIDESVRWAEKLPPREERRGKQPQQRPGPATKAESFTPPAPAEAVDPSPAEPRQPQPAAQTQAPGKQPTLEELGKIEGTARAQQRLALWKQGHHEAALRPGLTREKAGDIITGKDKKAPAAAR